MPPAGVLQETLRGSAGPAIVLDAQAGSLLAANTAGLELWGVSPHRLPQTVLDRAMPALTELRRQMDAPNPPVGRELLLTFWTERGLLCSTCRVQGIPGDASADLLLLEWPQMAATGMVSPPDPIHSHDPSSQPGLSLPMISTSALGELARRRREKAHASSTVAANATAVLPDQDGDTLANLAHELRTPLAAVIALAEIMTDEHLGPLPNERYRGYLRDIRDSARHGLALVDNLLGRDAAAAGDVKLELVCSEVDLNETVRFCASTMRALAENAGMTLSTELDERLPLVIADAHCVKQILLNLLSNSVKYAGSGARITVRTTYELAGRAWVEVTDNGPGIAPEIAASALEHVPRPAAAGRHPTNGRGLPLSRQLARANGASLEIESAGSGTVVRVAFPKDRLVPV